MILPQRIRTKITSKTASHYEKLGFTSVRHIDRDGVERLKQKSIEIDVHELPKTSHIKVKVACDVCGTIREMEYRFAIKSKNNICSDACLSLIKRNRAIENIEKHVNMHYKDFLYERYINESKTLRQIAVEVYGSETFASLVNHWMSIFNIPLRHGSEAIKTQWINSNDRRKLSSELAKNNLNSKESRQKLIKIMQTDEYREKSRQAKLGEKNPMYNVKGEAHHNWNPELKDEDRIRERKSFEDTQWRLEVWRRDQFKCQKCGLNRNLNAHHILNHKSHKELRYEVDNGITFCETCHIEFHKTYGYFNNNAKQINEYLEIKVTQ